MDSKVLCLITNSDLGGAQQHLLLLVEYYKIKGCKVKVISGEYGPLVEQFGKKNIEVKVISFGRSISVFRDLFYFIKLTYEIWGYNPDFIHSHSSKAGVLARFASVLLAKRNIFTVHGWSFTPGVPTYQRILGILTETLLAPATTGIICVSNYDYMNAIHLGIPNLTSVSVIHNSVPDKFTHIKKLKKNGEFTIVMVARFAKPKRQDLLLDFLKKNNKLNCIFVGSGPNKSKIENRVSAENMNNRVFFIGETTDVYKYYNKSDLNILLSDYEAFPMTIVESIMLGIPTIASDVGGIKEIISNNKNGFIIETEQVIENLSKIFADLELKPFLYGNISNSARISYLENFTVEIWHEKLNEFISKTVELN